MHTNDNPNTTANPNAEGDSAVQVRGRATPWKTFQSYEEAEAFMTSYWMEELNELEGWLNSDAHYREPNAVGSAVIVRVHQLKKFLGK